MSSEEFKNLEGKVCRLRLIKPEDAKLTFRWRGLERAALLNKGAQTVEQQKQWIESRPKNETNFIIELSNGSSVGMLSLIRIDQLNKTAESARFLIGEEDQVKGLAVAVESMLLLYIYAFENLDLNRIYGTIAGKNSKMIKWQKYLGMKQEGVLRQHYCIDKEFQDAVVMGLLRVDYADHAKRRMETLASW